MVLHRTKWVTASIVTTWLLCAPALAIDVRLGWLPVAGAAGYRVYWRTGVQAYGQGLDTGSVAPGSDGVVRYVVSNVDPNITNYFAVTSYDAKGVESPLSNELSLRAALRCAAAPISGCRPAATPKGAMLSLRNGTDANQDRLAWSWRQGTQGAAPFGDPPSGTNYVLCIYDESRSVANLAMSISIPAGGVCDGDGRPCWRDLGGRGFTYLNRSFGGGGVLKVKLKQRASGSETIQLNGAGQSFAGPPPVGGALFQQDPALMVQLVNDATPSGCWQATYSAAARVHTSTRFKDASD